MHPIAGRPIHASWMELSLREHRGVAVLPSQQNGVDKWCLSVSRAWESEGEWYDSVPPTKRRRNIKFRLSRGRGGAGEVDRWGIILRRTRDREGNKTASKYRISTVCGAEDIHGGAGSKRPVRKAQISKLRLAGSVQREGRGSRAERPLTRPSRSMEHTGKERETAWWETAFTR